MRIVCPGPTCDAYWRVSSTIDLLPRVRDDLPVAGGLTLPTVARPLAPDTGPATLPIANIAVARKRIADVPVWPRVRGYEVLSLIGCGGMGIVFKARHQHLNRIVALKTLRGSALADPEFHDRFRAEAAAVARLQHPNVIQVFEIGDLEPQPGLFAPGPFIALEFVDGGHLGQKTGKPQPHRVAAELVVKLAGAVQAAHKLGVVHRDLKPANVLLTPDGVPKIADFGLAKQLDATLDGTGRFETQAGTIVGTPEYMSPEQAAGAKTTPAIDIYALGVILYELLTARVPFQASTPAETMHLVMFQDPVSPKRLQPSVPRDLETICLKCLEKDPARRYATAEALANDLQRFLEHRPILARRTSATERLNRWCRRNPLPAASLVGVLGIIALAFALISVSYWREARQREAAEERERAERWERYRSNIGSAGSALLVYNVGGAAQALAAAPDEHRNWEWRHFQSRLDLARQVLNDSEFEISLAKITPNGRRALLIGPDGSARVCGLAHGRTTWTWAADPAVVVEQISPDGQLVLLSRDKQVMSLHSIDLDRPTIWLDQTAKMHWMQLETSRLVGVSTDGSVRIWDTRTGRKIQERKFDTKGFYVTSMSASGRVVGTETSDRSLVVWEVETGRTICTLSHNEFSIETMTFDHDERRIMTVEAYPGCRCHLYDVATGRKLALFEGHKNTVTDRTFSPDGKRIATCSRDHTIRLWNATDGKAIATLTGHLGSVNAIAFSPDGRRLASVARDHTARIWDGLTGEPIGVLHGHTDDIRTVAWAGNDSLVSASNDGTIRKWDARTVEDGILRGHKTFVYGVAASPDGKRFASASWDGTARIWDATTGKELAVLDHGTGEPAIVTSVAFHPTRDIVATRSRGSVRLWNPTTGAAVHSWNSPSDFWRDTRLSFNRDGSLLAAGCKDCVVRIWDTASHAEVAELRHDDQVRDVVFSPDGKLLATCTENGDRLVCLWDVATRSIARTLSGHEKCVYSLAFNGDGSIIASGSQDGTARLWDVATGTEIGVLKNRANVYGLAFTPDGSRLGAACADNTIRLWDVRTKQAVGELRGHPADVPSFFHQLVFTPDGRRLVSAFGGGTVNIWDTLRPQDR